MSMGLSAVRHTEPDKVRALIRSLSPEDCGKELIRLGGNTDGGYLIPDDLEGLEYCFSPGVSTVADFENQLADRGIKSFLADYSVSSSPISRPEFVFDKKFLGATDNEQYFTLASWKDKYLRGYGGDLLLEMDIEGCEYEVILNTPDDLLDQFRIIVIEFHDLHRMFDPFAFKIIESSFQKLLKHFHVAHIHPNNCTKSVRMGDLEIPPLLEFTFYNKNRVQFSKYAGLFPHPYDRDNFPELKTLQLPRCWYSLHHQERA